MCYAHAHTGIRQPKSLDRRRKADERFYCWLRTSQPRSAKGNEMVLHSVVDKTRGEKGRSRAGYHYIFYHDGSRVVQQYKNRGDDDSPRKIYTVRNTTAVAVYRK